jgi:FHA domain/IPT/TIG domain
VTETNPVAPLLIVTGGPLDGTELVFTRHGEKTLGASPECDLQLELGNVDPLHAGISWDSQGLVLTDMSSSTGTYVNGEKISGDHTLGDGDRVCLGPPGSKGSVKLLVRVPETGAAFQQPPAADEFSLSSDDGGVVLDSEEPFSLDGDTRAGSGQADTEPPLELEAPYEAPPTQVRTFQQPDPPSPPPPASVPPPAPRKPAKPEYTTDMPSIAAPERSREAVALPPAAPREIPRGKRAKKGGLDLSRIPRPALVGAAVVVLCLAVWAGFSRTQTPPPVLEGIVPAKVETGGTVTITGKGFDSTPARNVVRFGDQTGTVTSASATQLAVTVPNVETGDRAVRVESRWSRSNQLFIKIFKAPAITKLEPDVALPGEEIVANGVNLAPGNVTLSVGGQPAEVSQGGPTSFHFRVPQMVASEGRAVTVNLQVGTDFAKPVPLVLGHLPLVLEITPARALPGEKVTVKGRGFDSNPAGNIVSFGGQPALVLSASETALVVCAPATDRQVGVTVQAHGRTSSGPAMFAMTRASSAIFLLRYFPAPVTEKPGKDVVYVSTELGPTLLLGGKGDAASTPERAMAVAAALNGVAERAASAPVRLETRDKPPGVAVPGSTTSLVTVTSEDAGAYEGRLSPRNLATFWTALLQDQLSLFAMRERPTQVIQMTSRGRVLTDIYAEAVRRSGMGAGVSQGILSPLSSTRAQALRELALLPPSEGQSGAGAAVEGTWDGSMEESGVGSRRIQVKFKLKGSQLTGTMSTRSGKITAEVPLSDVAMQGPTLTFARTSGAAPLYFRGTLQGATVNGTIHAQPGAKDSVGQFSLTFTE